MAINYLNSVDLNQNQLIKAAIESQPNDSAAGTGVDGQLYFDSSLGIIKVWVTNQWVSISGDITGLIEGTDISITNADGPIPTINHADITRAANSATSVSPAYGGTFTAVDTITTSATGHVTAVNVKTVTLPADTNETYTLPVTAGTVTPGAPTSGKISLTAGGTGSGVKSTVEFIGTSGRIDITSVNQNDGSITINLTDDVSIVNDLNVGGEINQTSTGNENSFASPLNMNTTKITNIATGTAAGDGVNLGQVQALIAGIGVFQGGYNATTDPGVPIISGAANIKLDQGDYFVVSHDGDITFSGTTTTGVNSGALANSTALVLAAANADVAVGMDVTGTGVPPGITILTVTNSTNFVLSSAITIANTTTLTFSDKVVSVEVGDFIFANANIAANSDPAASEYTIVQSDANIAGAGATDGATEKGVAGFDSASFDVSAAGWVQLKPQSNPYGAKVTLDDGGSATPATSPCTRSESGGLTTFTIDITDASLFGTNALASNVKAEITQIATPYQTVYVDVARSGSGTISFAFTGSIASDVYAALLVYV